MHCGYCDATRHLSNVIPGRNPAPQPKPNTSKEAVVDDKSNKDLHGLNGWKEVVRRGSMRSPRMFFQCSWCHFIDT